MDREGEETTLFSALQQAVSVVPASVNHFYLDWTFWQGFVALLALVLSQLPPLVTLLRPGRLKLDVPARILLTHKVGNSNVSMLMSLRNVGGRDIRVRSIYIVLKRSKGESFQIEAQQFEVPGAVGMILFVPFVLSPRNLWSRNVLFFNELDRQTDKIYRASRLAMQNQIRERLAERPKDQDKVPVTVDDNLVQPFLKLFHQQFRWQPGEYELQVVVVAEPGNATLRNRYRFTLFESDTEELKEHLQEFPIGGGGITFIGEKTTNVWVPLTEEKV